MSFGRVLKQLRRERKVTQQELADYIGVVRTSIAGYETKKKHPDFEKLRLISQFFNVSTDYLLEIEGNLKLDEPEITTPPLVVYNGDVLPDEALADLEDYVRYLEFKYKEKE